MRVVAVVALSVLLPVAPNHKLKPTIRHTRGCKSFACDRRVGHAWWLKHHPRPTAALGALESCVILHESTFNRYASNGVDFSYYQWEPATLREAEKDAGERVYSSPFEAPLENQTLAFRAYEPSHRTAWPVTVPECGG